MSVDCYSPAQLKRREPVVCEGALPCPFCGQPAYRRLWHGGSPGKTAVYCGSQETGEDCPAAPFVCGENRAQAIRFWNTRRRP